MGKTRRENGKRGKKVENKWVKDGGKWEKRGKIGKNRGKKRKKCQRMGKKMGKRSRALWKLTLWALWLPLHSQGHKSPFYSLSLSAWL